MRNRTAALFVFLASLLISSSVAAEEFAIVSPNALADVEGDDNVALTCCPEPFRYQQVFPAEDFDSLPSGGALLTEMAFRPDGILVTEPREVLWSDAMFRASTTSVEPNSLSLVYADNIEGAQTTVLSGTFKISTNNTGPARGPKEFDYIFDFDTPFFYDPSQGNLLLDFTGSFVPSTIADSFSEPLTSIFGSPIDDEADFRLGGLVVQFTFVPEPSSLVLATLALMGMVRCKQVIDLF